MAGLQIVNRDKDGNIKQDYHAYRDKEKGRVVEVDKLKKAEEKENE